MRIAENSIPLLNGWDAGKFNMGNFIQDSAISDEDLKKAYNRPHIYHSGARMDLFAQESNQQLSRIYQYPLITGAPTDGFNSTLDLRI